VVLSALLEPLGMSNYDRSSNILLVHALCFNNIG